VPEILSAEVADWEKQSTSGQRESANETQPPLTQFHATCKPVRVIEQGRSGIADPP
jgi:hypothetical protein